jgi:hypothetical protein
LISLFALSIKREKVNRIERVASLVDFAFFSFLRWSDCTFSNGISLFFSLNPNPLLVRKERNVRDARLVEVDGPCRSRSRGKTRSFVCSRFAASAEGDDDDDRRCSSAVG